MKKSLLITFLSIGSMLNMNAQNLNGNWVGKGKQVDGLKWDIVLDIKNDNNISINYPTLGCSGSWTLESSSENVSVFTERITTGLDNCDQGAEIHLSQKNNKQIKVIYYLRSYDPVNPIAKGKLKRKK